MEVHPASKGLEFSPEPKYEVYDTVNSNTLIGFHVPDLAVEGKVVVELKALHGLDDSHVAQVISYLAVTGCKVGLLILFGKNKLQVKRILPPKDLQTHRANRQWLRVPNSLRVEQDQTSTPIPIHLSTPLSVPSVPSSASSAPSVPQSAFVRLPCHSEAEFLSVAASTNRTVEWIEGEIIHLPPNTISHQLIVGNFFSAFTRYIGLQNLRKLLPIVSVKLWSGTFRTPDLTFISTAKQINWQQVH
jgi:GxxExxY protein